MMLKFRSIVIVLMTLVLGTGHIFAVTNTASGGTTWAGATWSQGHVPTNAEDVIINSGVNLTIGTAAVCASLALGSATTTATTLTIGAGGSLSVTTAGGGTGNLSINPNNQAVAMTLICGVNSCTVAGTLTMSGTGTNGITLSTGTLTFSRAGGVTLANGSITMTGAGTINFTGLLTHTGGTLSNTTAAGTINFDAGYTKSGGTLTTLANEQLLFGGSFSVSTSSVTFTSGSRVIFDGTATITPTAAITFDSIRILGVTVTLAGNITCGSFYNQGGTLTAGGFTVSFAGSSRTIDGSVSTAFAGITINNGASITMNNNNTGTNLIINGTSSSTSLTHGSGDSLALSGTVTINQPTSNSRTNSWAINSGLASVGGLITFAGSNTTTSRVGTIVITGGKLYANGGMTFTAGASACHVVNMSGAPGTGSLYLKGALTVPAASSTLTAGTSGSNFSYSDASAQTINYFSSGAYNNLLINNTNGSTGASLSAAITTSNVTGNIVVGDINSGSKFTTGNFNIGMNASKTLTLNTGSTMNAGTSIITMGTSATVTLNGTFQTANTTAFTGNASGAISSTNTPTISLGASSTIEYSSTLGQAVTSRTDYANVTLSGGGSSKTPAAGTITMSGNLTIGSTVSYTGTTNNPTLNIGGNFTFNGTSFQQGSNLVTFNGTTAQTISGTGVTFSNNVTVANTSAALNVSVNTVFSGTLTVNANATLNPAAGVVLSGGGTLTGSGTVQVTRTAATADFSSQYTITTKTLTNLTVEYTNSSGSQVVSALTYGGLKMSNTSGTNTVGGAVTVNGTFTSTAGGTLNMGTNTLTVTTVNHSGILQTQNTSGTPFTASKTWGGTVELNGAGQSIPTGSNFNNLTCSGSGTKTIGGAVSVAGTLTISGTATTTVGSNTLTLNGDFSGSSTNKLILNGSSNLTIGGTGTMGNLFFDQTTDGTSNKVATFTIDRTGQTITMGNSLHIGTTLTLTNGDFAIGSNTLTFATGASLSADATDCLIGSGNSNLTFTGSGATGNIFFDQSTPGTTNNIATFTLNRTGVTAALGNNLQISTSLALTNGRLSLAGNTLTLNGSISGMTSTNCLVGSATSNLIIGGSGALGTSLFFSQIANNDSCLNNLTITRTGAPTITLGNKLMVYGTLSPTLTATLATGGNLILGSTASETARIATVNCTSCSYISGSVKAQRFVPSFNRAFRFLSSPVSGATLADWQSEIHITGVGGATNGFDATSANNPSVYTYDESVTSGDLNTGWTAATNTSNAITVGKGYRVFVRGTRAAGRLDGSILTQDAVTLDLNGTPNMGDQNLAPTFNSSGVLANDGWNLLGNPYASPIHWENFYDTANQSGSNYSNLTATVYIYDPNNNNWGSYNANTSTLNDGAGINAMSGNPLIPSGAAFFVKATASPTLLFQECHKSSGTPAALFKAGGDTHFYIEAVMDSANKDMMKIIYDANASNELDNGDIPKMYGPGVNLASIAGDSDYLALNRKPFNGVSDSIWLSFGIKKDYTGTFVFKIRNTEFLVPDADIPVMLEDLFEKKLVDLRNDSEYSFTADYANLATWGNERFRIIIGKKTGIEEWTADLNHQRFNAFIQPTIAQDYTSVYANCSISGQLNYVIADISGKVITKKSDVWNQNKFDLDLQSLKAGLYFVKLTTDKGESPRQALKFVKF